MSQIQPADIKTRRNVLIGLGIILLATLLLRPIFEDVGEWFAQDPESIRQKIPILVSGIFLAFIPLLFIGIYCWRLGRSVITSGRFPAPGMKVLVDTPIVRGPKALIQGRLLQILGILLSATAIGFPFAFWFIVDGLTRNAS